MSERVIYAYIYTRKAQRIISIYIISIRLIHVAHAEIYGRKPWCAYHVRYIITLYYGNLIILPCFWHHKRETYIFKKTYNTIIIYYKRRVMQRCSIATSRAARHQILSTCAKCLSGPYTKLSKIQLIVNY